MLAKPYILIAEDDPDDQEMIKKAILRYSPDVDFVWVKDGPDLLAFLDEARENELPALIILDYKLPIMTAADVLDIMNQNSRHISITKMVWSTSNRPEYVDKCIQRGAGHYFLKPTSVEQLQNIVQYIIDSIDFHQSIWASPVSQESRPRQHDF